MRLPARSFTDRAAKGLSQAQLNACAGADPALQRLTDDVIEAVFSGWNPAGSELARRYRLGEVAHQLGFIPSEQALRGAAIHHLVSNHSPKLTKAQRRARRKALTHSNTVMQRAVIKYKTYELGIAKMKEMFDGAGDPGYDHPQFATRTGRRRHQRRVRGRLQPIGRQPQRERTDRRVQA